MRPIAFFLALPFLFAACQSADTPESVVRRWQAHIDNNEFQEAMVLSAPRTVDLLSWMEALLAEVDADSIITHTEFKELSCRETGDKAVCYYTIEEEGVLFQDSFLLVRTKGKWLVDMPDEPVYEEDPASSLFDLVPVDTTELE